MASSSSHSGSGEASTSADHIPATQWPEATRPDDLRSSAFGTTLLNAAAIPARDQPVVFDVCHVGVVLRAVLFVNAAVAIGTLFAAPDLASWLSLAPAALAAALAGVLSWLLVTCLVKRALGALPVPAQWVATMALGAAGGLFGWLLVVSTGLDLFTAGHWLAPVLAGAGMAAVIFLWLRLRAAARLPADTTARLAELQSRIRPHFLFNTLNTALSLVRLDPARAEHVLEDLAELFRVALTDSGESVSLAEEVELAQRYLAIEQIRFGQRLKVSWELDPAAGAARVPPLLLQPLVENAVRHGVEPADQGGTVRIRSRVRHGRAIISIANTVPPSPSRPGNGIALANVRERLRLMHDVAAHFDSRLDRNVFRVQIVVPL
jgi:two-component system sensor histidine kinase AlgZ